MGGAVFALASLRGGILAAVKSVVQYISLTDGGSGSGGCRLKIQGTCDGQIMALYLEVQNNDLIVVGDLMKSMTLFQFVPTNKSFVEVARDYGCAWLTSLGVLDAPLSGSGQEAVGYVGGENSCNLFTLVRASGSGAADDDRRLVISSQYHIGMFVNKFVRGSLVMQQPSSDLGVLPTLLFGTVSGALGVIASIPESLYTTLTRLQTILTEAIPGVGGLEHSEWRAFSNDLRTVPASGVIDGDLIERFLELDSASRKRVGDRVGIPPAELESMIEDLARRLH